MRTHARAFVFIVLTLTLPITLTGCAQLRMVQTVESLLRQAKELYAAGRYDDALVKLREVISRDPKSWEAYLYAARSYIAKQTWAAAIENGRKALEFAPAKNDVIPVLAEALLGGGIDAVRRGQPTEAIGHLVEYVRLRPNDTRALFQLGRAYLDTRAYGDALRAFTQALAQSTDPALRREALEVLLDGGGRALAQGNPRDAIGFWQEAVRLDPSNFSAYLGLGRAYWQAGETARALSAFQRVLELSPNNEEALRFMRGGAPR